MNTLDAMIQEIDTLNVLEISGVVVRLQGLIITIKTNQKNVSVGTRCKIQTHKNGLLLAEVVGFDEDHALVMPYGDVMGVAAGAAVFLEPNPSTIYPDASWCGRVFNALGEVMDGQSPPVRG